MIFCSFYFLFTPIIPPNAPANMLAIIIIIEYIFNEKFFVIMLEIKYIEIIYINPTIIPVNIPFFFILYVLIVPPINILIAVIIIVTSGIVCSCNFVYVNINENTIYTYSGLHIDTRAFI